jgi:hypothetical protein
MGRCHFDTPDNCPTNFTELTLDNSMLPKDTSE